MKSDTPKYERKRLKHHAHCAVYPTMIRIRPHFVWKNIAVCAPANKQKINLTSPNIAPATKSDQPRSPNIALAKKSDKPRLPNIAPGTKSDNLIQLLLDGTVAGLNFDLTERNLD